MKTDNEIIQYVRDEIQWDARCTASEIGFTVKGYHVTLSGSVHSMAQKNNARWTAYCALGITSVEKISAYPLSSQSTAGLGIDIKAELNLNKNQRSLPILSVGDLCKMEFT